MVIFKFSLSMRLSEHKRKKRKGRKFCQKQIQ